MRLPFLNRQMEMRRLREALAARQGALVVLYGRRRCGKSRLLLEAVRNRQVVYYVGDEREAGLQRQSLAKAVSALIAGFDRVEYPDWEALLDRWWREAPPRAILALDEFPNLVARSPELPSLLQKKIDAPQTRPRYLILCGSSQRMMQGLVLDATAPLYGRAREIIKLEPMAPGWLRRVLGSRNAFDWLEAFAVWGGVPRYWELANEFKSTREAIHHLVLDPSGVLQEEPARLLLDDLQEIAQASSILSLIGEGCHKISEIAGRLGKPATSLSRPLGRLVGLGLVRRELPFGSSERDSKRSQYRIADPFLNFWFRFVGPNRSLIEARQWPALQRDLEAFFPGYLGEVWEDVARMSVPGLSVNRQRWRPASRWWGAGPDRKPLEIDIVALSEDKKSLLVGEAKLRVRRRDWEESHRNLRSKVARFPLAQGKNVIPCIWYGTGDRPPARLVVVSARQAFEALR